MKKGTVYLVGAGPGDPGLLTLKGKECIEKADVIVYDYLANRVFLEYANENCEMIYVGKKAGSHTLSQDEINKLICDRANMGLNVVRLKGGDPFIFGRGGEEAQELLKAGIPFEIVPGITSAIAVPAYAGIPITHRDYTATAAFITGHEDPYKDESDIDWEKISTGAGTLVFLMGIGNLRKICNELIRNGRSPDTPAAIILNGTLPDQRTIEGTLKEISDIAERENARPPGIIIVGDVVGLRPELCWFEKRPLFGKRIVVTRAREQASVFLARLSELGALCIEFPTIKIAPPDNWEEMDRTIQLLDSYRWLLFTSVNGVKYFFDRLRELGKDVRALRDLRIGAIGPKTAKAVEEKGIVPDLVPDEYRAEAVIKAFEKEGISDLKILLPRASEAREILPEELKKMGAKIDVVKAYRTVMPEEDAGKIRSMLQEKKIDMVTFTSSSTVHNFMKMLGEKADQTGILMNGVDIACIGPVTADTAKKYGLGVTVMPEDYTIEGLTDAIVEYFSRQRPYFHALTP